MKLKFFLLVITFYNIQSCAQMMRFFCKKRIKCEELLLSDIDSDNFLEDVAVKVDGAYLIKSAMDNHLLGVKLALSNKVNINYIENNFDAISALECTIFRKHFDLMMFLLAQGAEIRYGLILAVRFCDSNIRLIRYLISAGANIDLKDQYGNDALYYAKQINNQAVIDLLTMDRIVEV